MVSSLSRVQLSGLLAGAAISMVVVGQSSAVFAQTAKDVARVAVPTTVRIDNLLSPKDGGSGVIIARNGNTYTVLTANHVVRNPNSEYKIYTSKKKTYAITSIKGFQKTENDTDLAIVTFESPEEQAVAALSNSDEASIGSGVYISGYPQSAEDPSIREYEFTAGQVSSRPDSRPRGYTMRYDAVTRRGMSGGPVFDVNGRVVGIHGEGDREGVIKAEAGGSNQTVELKTNFNAAIPINTFMSLAPQFEVNASSFTVDNAPPANVAAVQPSREEVRSWEQDFALGVGLSIIRQLGVPVPFGIPGLPF